MNKLKSMLDEDKPVIISLTVNEVKINSNHWYQWPNQGTRLTGNACHWIDLCQYLIGSEPIELTVNRSQNSMDDCCLVVCYKNGSLATMTFTDKGCGTRGVQELIEVKQNDATYRIDDMLSLTVDKMNRTRSVYRSVKRDKGHKRMYESFSRSVLGGRIQSQYPLTDLELVSEIMCTASTMLINNERHKILR